MVNRRRFLKLAGITALATAAPRIPLAFGDGGLLHVGVQRLQHGVVDLRTQPRHALGRSEPEPSIGLLALQPRRMAA